MWPMKVLGTATVTDIATEKIIAAIPVNAKPADVGVSPDGGNSSMWVAAVAGTFLRLIRPTSK